MKYLFSLLLLATFSLNAQTNTYNISFENAIHHEAKISVHFPELKSKELTVRMSRSSPGRYAIHEFAKNVYGVVATNSAGDTLEVERPDPYSWKIKGHDGEVTVHYTLFANRADGTYSQVDETHAHLNIPATFMFSEEYEHRPVSVNFDLPEKYNWKVATQLKKESETEYSAPNLYYFMDSPIEISDFMMRSFDVNGQSVELALHHNGTETEADQYFEKVKAVVLEEKKVYGELPKFDYGKYTFLACYIPNASGDGMEHRNSTILTSTRSLADGGMDRNIGTVAHEFFHAWNVERIRPDELEPFDFTEANMTGSLWFAEGFTSYYTNLTLCRAGLMSPKDYVEGLDGTFNYVWNSPAHDYFNPIEMSYQAPFVDAATSVDPVNRENTFISYYSYGSILGLALDLQLRENDLNLDDFMKLMWTKFGKKEIAYEIEDIESTLAEYAGKDFAENFFGKYIYQSKMPNYENLLKLVGVSLEQNSEENYLGAGYTENDGTVFIYSNPQKGSPAYKAGLISRDVIKNVNGQPATTSILDSLIKTEDKLKLLVERNDSEKEFSIDLEPNPEYVIEFMENPNKEAIKNRNSWLKQDK